ncbi:lasso RiPP family leader peptide-containing protein [Saccharopolyspora cebuensis]|uniref:Lasso RiPP family leader peptide-containing protein n=1 Tax=Saccharopolyspora cebuensis TaxID=418759 RepID=A0ABV4CKN7_9PSEU
MDTQYTAPELVEVGEFSADTLGGLLPLWRDWYGYFLN